MDLQQNMVVAAFTVIGVLMMLTSAPRWRFWLLNFVYIWDVIFFIASFNMMQGTASGVILACCISFFLSVSLRVIKRMYTPEVPKVDFQHYKPRITWNAKEIRRT